MKNSYNSKRQKTTFNGQMTDTQQEHEKVHVLNITSHQGNANQNHKELKPHTCWNGYFQKDSK